MFKYKSTITLLYILNINIFCKIISFLVCIVNDLTLVSTALRAMLFNNLQSFRLKIIKQKLNITKLKQSTKNQDEYIVPIFKPFGA